MHQIRYLKSILTSRPIAEFRKSQGEMIKTALH
jgi:hypothetical protein